MSVPADLLVESARLGATATAAASQDRTAFSSTFTEPRPVSKRQLRLRFHALLMASDWASVAGAILIANLIRFGDPFASPEVSLFAVLLPFLGAAFTLRAYALEVAKKPHLGMLRSAGALTAAFATVLALVFFLKESEDFSRIVIGTVFVLSLAFIISGRAVLGAVARRRLGDNPFDELVITDGAYFPEAGSSVRVLDAQRAGLTPSLQDPNMLNRLGRAVAGYDRVLVACPAERRGLWSMLLKGANVDGEVLSAECEDIGAIGIGRWGDRVTLRVACGPLHMQERLLKRALDLSIAVPLLVLLAPLLLVVAIAIKMDSPGPIFFRQTRMGRGNTTFDMLKFRSMKTSQLDHAGNRSTGRNDDRITRVGRFIRRTSIDELPQLLNVLKGDMSLVGPRPHALGSLAGEKLFWEVDQRYWLRHACKPGMTGLAQVRGFRGATEQTHDLTNRLKADLEYLDDWTIWRDIGILLRTLQVVVHPQAY